MSLIAITGATGFIGSALVHELTAAGHAVRRMVRREGQRRPGDALWDPAAGRLDPRALDGVDAVIHLAGEPIAQRWTAAAKRRIRESRVRGTQLVATTIASLAQPPRVLVSGSAMGIYGDRGDEELDETSAPGRGFLAEVAIAWEVAAEPAARAGVRVVKLRTGLVLGPRGGALAKLLLPFRMGVGGRVGSGRQWVSWIGLDDAVGAIMHTVDTETLAGPVNLAAPSPVANAEFTKTLARVLRRPAIIPMPAFAMRLVFGEMGEATLLASQRMRPRRLLESGYRFRHPTLEAALRHELGR
ncbi:MAG: TIGR01777 family oxidoreductase [Gemmatimonadota bacterium]|nr:TIGR01777 family oxidoreductase [Gemmatimonadota bacterium]